MKSMKKKDIIINLSFLYGYYRQQIFLSAKAHTLYSASPGTILDSCVSCFFELNEDDHNNEGRRITSIIVTMFSIISCCCYYHHTSHSR